MSVYWLFILLVFLRSSALTTADTIGGREVKVMKDKEKWPIAYEKCSSIGMELLVISSIEEDDQLLKLMLKENVKEIWLGATIIGWNKFMWMATGRELKFNNWAPGEPNNPDSEKCLVRYDRPRSWNDVSCTRFDLDFICQQTEADVQLKQKIAELKENGTAELKIRKEQYEVLVEKNRIVEKNLTDLMAVKHTLDINLEDMTKKHEDLVEKLQAQTAELQKQQEQYDVLVENNRKVERNLTGLIAVDQALNTNFDDLKKRHEEMVQNLTKKSMTLNETQKELIRVKSEMKEQKDNLVKVATEHWKMEIDNSRLIGESDVKKQHNAFLIILLCLSMAINGGLVIALIVIIKFKRKRVQEIELSQAILEM